MLLTPCLDENSALELLDGRLAAAARTEVERHIASCDACRELVAELAKVDEAETERTTSVVDTERTPFGRLREASEPGVALAQVGPYRIESEVGSGSAGTVFRARDTRTNALVALKYVTDVAWRTRFAREAETLARLGHPNIVRYVDHGETPAGMYLAMEWLEGENLEECLRRGPLPWQVARILALGVTAGLAHAHALGFVHRDLTPRNIFLPGGRVENMKLLDFGLVRLRDGLDRTGSQAVLGTPYYMAPEQVRDPRNVDARADLFTLGVVLYEAVSGTRPFYGGDLFTVWLRIVDLAAVDLRTITRGVPEAFIRVIEALMAKDPNARPPSAGDVHRALLDLDAFAYSSADLPMMPRGVSSPPHPAQSSFLPSSAGPGPSITPRHAVSAPPPRRGSGVVYVAAGVGVTALVAASTLAVVASRVLGPRDATASASGAPSPSGAGDRAPGPSLAPDDGDPNLNDTPTRPGPVPAPAATQVDAGVPAKNPRLALPESPEPFFCGSEGTELRRGGHYEPAPDMKDIAYAVNVGGTCKAILEDCTIDGPRSVRLLGPSPSLTLRRCRVLGAVSIVGGGTLTLEGTALSQAAVILGKGRVIGR